MLPLSSAMNEEASPHRASESVLDRAFERAVDLIELRPRALIDEIVDELIQELSSPGSIAQPSLALEIPSRDSIVEVVRLAYAVVPGAQAADLPKIPKYTCIRELGRGGMGAVFLARQDLLAGRLVAVKILPAGAAISARARERFRREAEAVARLQHPGITAVHDITEAPGLYAYAMEYVDGASLAYVMSRLGQPGSDGAPERLREILDVMAEADTKNPTRFMIRVCAAVADALSSVHEAGLLHRDVKPSNILLRRDGTALLSDFGLARDVDAMMTEPGQFAGTPVYAAPEQLRGERIDARADVYALGVTLYHALAGVPPYAVTTTHELIRQIEGGRVPSVRRVCPQVPPDVALVVAKAMSPDPAQRYQSARAFADDLQRLLDNRPVLARPATTWYTLSKFVRRNPVLVAGLIAVFVTLTLGLAGTFWQARTATRARDEARAEREVARFKAYVANITASDAALRASDPFAARSTLMSADRERRGWEWWYLESRLDASVASLPTVWTVNAMALSPDGQWAAASATNTLVFNLSDARLRTRESGPFDLAAFSPDSRALITIKEGLATLRELSPPADPPDSADQPRWRTIRQTPIGSAAAISFSADGVSLLSVHPGGILRTWNARTMDKTGEHALEIDGTVHAWNQRLGLIAVAAGDAGLRLLDENTGRVKATLDESGPVVRAAAISADGARIAALGGDSMARVWDMPTPKNPSGRVISRAMTPDASRTLVDLSPDGSMLVVASDRIIRVYDARTGAKRSELAGHARNITDVAFSSDGRSIVSAGTDLCLKLWDAPDVTRDNATTLDAGETSANDPIANATWIDSVSDVGMIIASGNRVLTYDDAGKSVIAAVTHADSLPVSVSGSPTRPLFAVAWSDGSASTHDWPSGNVRWRGKVFERGEGDKGLPMYIAVAPDGERVFITADQRAVMWDGALARVLWEHPLGDPYRGIAFSPDGRYVVVGEDRSEVVLRDPVTGKELRRWPGPGGPSRGLAFSRDSSWLAMGSLDRTARVWDVRTGRPVAVLSGSPHEITRVRFSNHADPTSPDARLFSIDTRGMIRVWDVLQGSQVFSVLAGTGGWGYSIALSPDDSSVFASLHIIDGAKLIVNAGFAIHSHGQPGRLVSDLLEELLVPQRVVSALEARDDLDPVLRAAAIDDARRRSVDAGRLNFEAWGIACFQGRSAEDYARAERLAAAAAEIAPDNGHIHGTHATALYRTGKYEQALAASLRAQAINGRFSPDESVRAMILVRLGRSDEARALLARKVPDGGEVGLLYREAKELYAQINPSR